MKIILLISITLLSSTYSYAEFDCKDLVGSWQGEIYNYEKNYRDTFIDVFKEDGTFSSYYDGQTLDGTEDSITIDIGENLEEGTWACDGNSFSMITTKDKGVEYFPEEKIYKILELNTTNLKYQTVKGHSIGLTYDVFKK